MTQHPKTKNSYLNKAELYYQDEGQDVPIIEHAAIYDLIPNLSKSHALSIGCGAGKELHALNRKGALTITAIEPSDYLRKKAKEEASFADIVDGDLEALPFPDATFNFIYCGHVLHYFKDWTKALSEIKRVLWPHGSLLITLHHPLDWGLAKQTDQAGLLGYTKDKQEVGNYLTTREIQATWYNDFDVVFYSRSIGTSINEITKFGFTLSGLNEAGLTESAGLPLYYAMLLRGV